MSPRRRPSFWQKTEDELAEAVIGLPPLFLGFRSRAGGQALARSICSITSGDHRAAGASSISPAGSGAGRYCGCERLALHGSRPAISMPSRRQRSASNASRQRRHRSWSRCDDLIGRDDEGWGRPSAPAMLLRARHGRACHRLALGAGGTRRKGADRRSRPKLLPKDGAPASSSATYEVPVTRSLEDAEIKRSSVWRLASG